MEITSRSSCQLRFKDLDHGPFVTALCKPVLLPVSVFRYFTITLEVSK